MPACLAFVCLLTQVYQEPYMVVDSSSRGTVVSADEGTVATLNYSGTIVIWRATKPRKPLTVVRVIRPSGEAFGLISLSPHGERLATVNPNGRIRIFDLHNFHMSVDRSLGTGEENAWYRPEAFSWQPRESRFVVSMSNGTSMMENSLHKFVSIPVDGPLSWSPNGLRVAGLVRGGAAIYDVTAKNIIRTFKEPLETYGPVALSPDEKYLITGGEDPKWNGPDVGPDGMAPSEAAYAHQQKLKVWRVADGKRTRLIPGFESYSGSGEVTFLSARRVAIPSYGDVYDIITGRRVQHVEISSQPDEEGVEIGSKPSQPYRPRYLKLPAKASVDAALGFSTDGKYLSFGGNEKADEAFVWDLAKGTMKARLKGPGGGNYRDVRFLSTGELALNTRASLKLFSKDFAHGVTRKGPVVNYDRDADLPKGIDPPHFNTIQLLPDGKRAVTSENSATRSILWDIHSGKKIGEVPSRGFDNVLYSQDGSKQALAVYSQAGQLNVGMQDTITGKKLWAIHDYDVSVGLAFSPDEKLLAAAALRRRPHAKEQFYLALLDTVSGKVVREVEIQGVVQTARFTPDGESLFVSGSQGVQRYRTATLRQVSSLPVLSAMRGSMAISPDGNLLAVATKSVNVRIIDAKTLQVLVTIVPFTKDGWVAYTLTGAANGTPAGLGRLLAKNGDFFTPLSSPIRPEELSIHE